MQSILFTSLFFTVLSNAAPVHSPKDLVPSWWAPTIGSSFQIQLRGQLDPTVDAEIYDVDVMVADDITATVEAVKASHPDRRVICYVNVAAIERGTSRDDFSAFAAIDNAIGNVYKGWEGETYIDFRIPAVRDLLTKRLEQAKDKGCDAVDPDNIALDYSNGSGFTPDISKDDQNEFIQWLTAEAHRIGLGVGCKNCASLWTDETRDAVISLFDFAVVEECDRYNECDKYEGFIAQMKPVFDIEYTDATGGDCSINTKSISEICGNLNRLNIDGVIKGCQLGAQVTQCRRLASDFE